MTENNVWINIIYLNACILKASLSDMILVVSMLSPNITEVFHAAF